MGSSNGKFEGDDILPDGGDSLHYNFQFVIIQYDKSRIDLGNQYLTYHNETYEGWLTYFMSRAADIGHVIERETISRFTIRLANGEDADLLDMLDSEAKTLLPQINTNSVLAVHL